MLFVSSHINETHHEYLFILPPIQLPEVEPPSNTSHIQQKNISKSKPLKNQKPKKNLNLIDISNLDSFLGPKDIKVSSPFENNKENPKAKMILKLDYPHFVSRILTFSSKFFLTNESRFMKEAQPPTKVKILSCLFFICFFFIFGKGN
jgi:hypothetical protein